MHIKKITTRLLFLFLCPYVVSMFWATNTYENTQDMMLVKEQRRVLVNMQEDAGVWCVDLETYILGLLPLVVPISYEPEALKAQAVLLRTQLIKEYEETGEVKACKEVSWLSMEQMKSLWGTDFDANYLKIKQAVEETQGLYLMYEEKPIHASYFRVSNGKTRNGAELLEGKEYAYLQSVDCEEDFLSEDYLFQKEIKIIDFCRQLNIKKEDLNTLKVYKDMAGYCSYVSIYRQEKPVDSQLLIGGEQFRILFDLPSAAFEIHVKEATVQILGKGAGHGLGMSQFAANEMAKDGQDFMAILYYFFTDIAFDKFE